MYHIYMDSGTTNTKVFLVREGSCIDTLILPVGTKDSAISGSNEILLQGLKKGYDDILKHNGVLDSWVTQICLSGMVTNPFGIIEVPHISTPVGYQKLWAERYLHFEQKYFQRELVLIRGVKTGQPDETVTMENMGKMNNVRGEEMEVVGMLSKGVLSENETAVMISPGSHTHMLYIKSGMISDIVSNFTGELYHAIQKETIFAGELVKEDIPLAAPSVLEGYHLLTTYGLARALYIVHGTKVFGVCEDKTRNALLMGLIVGSVIEMLQKKIEYDWADAKKAVIIGGKHYIEAYKILGSHYLPNMKWIVEPVAEGENFGLQGYYKLLEEMKKGDGVL
ncbi:2-keto-3-deoxy-galactonokinase [Anaerotignum neopropionicum]|uniref:2-keto-3-deoxy-galactonokinase n=1 Tax=Anaerotignum neopropionicum TaxID=36847 RepID=A0A136WG58_9FIRM|nr:2-dehydro-3-deoxygalactonokinase [Anaerotignum neopropionicum]KXL53447.1 2-keto-3-deoxy-galactonokinase [Anaerotignum neopropionicum]